MVKQSLQSSQNSKFAISLKCLKKDDIDFFHADKHQSFLQVDCNTLNIKVLYEVILSLLMSMNKHSKITQSNKFRIFL